jgi:hypothetical protein
VLGSLIIKYLCHLDDREVVEQISENIYMQYFLGYSSFVNEKPFDASLFVELRKRVGVDVVNSINERIVALKTHFESKEASKPEGNVPPKDDSPLPPTLRTSTSRNLPPTKGRSSSMPLPVHKTSPIRRTWICFRMSAKSRRN